MVVGLGRGWEWRGWQGGNEGDDGSAGLLACGLTSQELVELVDGSAWSRDRDQSRAGVVGCGVAPTGERRSNIVKYCTYAHIIISRYHSEPNAATVSFAASCSAMTIVNDSPTPTTSPVHSS